MPGQIKKITVKHIGVLKAFATPSAPQLAQLTTFYGKNGRGKSTLSAILRSAAKGSANHLTGRTTFGVSDPKPEVNLILESGSVRMSDNRWTPTITPIDVFDTTFIADNLFAGETPSLDHDRGLFTVILGTEGVALIKHQDFFNAATKRTTSRLKEAETALKDDLPTDMTREEFFAFASNESVSKQLVQAEKDLKALQQESRISGIAKLELLPVFELPQDMEALLSATVENIEADARDHLAAHFKKFGLGKRGEAWIKFGLDHIHEDSCPFCGKSGIDDLGMIDVYSKIFGETYKEFFDKVRETAERVEAQIGPEALEEFERRALGNLEAIAHWSEFVDLDGQKATSAEQALNLLDEVHKSLKTLFDAKRQSPLSQIADDGTVTKALSTFSRAMDSFAEYNQGIAGIRSAVASRAKPLTEAQARMRVANLTRRARRNDDGVQNRIQNLLRAQRADQRAKKLRTLVQDRLKIANKSAASHYYARVNHYLTKFGATFQISEISNSMSGNIGSVDYGLVVRGHPVVRGRGEMGTNEASFKTSLSTGDKTSLAFAFFLALLDRHPTLEDRIVVFDDPLSSHDSHRKLKTVEFLNGIVRRSRQVIVLSHDAHFLRDVVKRCSDLQSANYQIEFDGESWSKATEADMDELCQSEFQSHLSTVKRFYDRTGGSAAEVAPVIRKVLEGHYRRAYSAYFLPTENLGGIIQKIRDEGEYHPCWSALETLEACNETKDEHHGENPTVVRTPIDDDNLRVLAGECLVLVNAVRPASVTSGKNAKVS